MTTAKEPWSVRHNIDPQGSAAIIDAMGDVIGVFADGRNAERFIEVLKLEAETTRDLIDEAERASDEVESMEKEIADLKKQLEAANAKR